MAFNDLRRANAGGRDYQDENEIDLDLREKTPEYL